MAHDLAGVAASNDGMLHGAVGNAMKGASFMFYHVERFNREATALEAIASRAVVPRRPLGIGKQRPKQCSSCAYRERRPPERQSNRTDRLSRYHCA